MVQIWQRTVSSVNTCASRRPYRVSRSNEPRFDPDTVDSRVTCVPVSSQKIMINRKQGERMK